MQKSTKFICVKNTPSNRFTVGKVYVPEEDGLISDRSGYDVEIDSYPSQFVNVTGLDFTVEGFKCVKKFDEHFTLGNVYGGDGLGVVLDDDCDSRFLLHTDCFEAVISADKPLQAPKEPVSASSTQVGGSHYTEMGIQPLEVTYLNFGYEGLKASIFTKVLKYMGRKKDNEVEQLKKARHCLDLLIEKAELENK